MRPKALLLLVPIALIAAIYFVSDKLGTKRQPVDSVESQQPEAAQQGSDLEREVEAQLPSSLTESQGQRSGVEVAATATEPSGIEASSASFITEDADWIAGRLQLPSQLAMEVSMELVAYSSMPDDPEAWESDVRTYGASELLEPVEESPEEPNYARVAIAPDGSFNAPFKKGREKGLLLLQSDFLYAAPLEVDAADKGPLELTSELGGRLVIQIQPPVDATQDELDELRNFVVGFGGWGSKGALQRRAILGEDLSLTSFAMPTGTNLWLNLDNPDYVPATAYGKRIRSGELVTQVTELKRGVRFQGLVTNAAAEPIEGAEVSYVSESRQRWGRAPERSAESNAKGEFDLRGVPTGDVKLRASHAGYVPVELKLEDLDDNARSSIDFVLRTGGSLAGKVQSDEGNALAQAEIQVKDIGSGDSNHPDWARTRNLQSAADGSFNFTGLGNGPFAMRVRFPADDKLPASMKGSFSPVSVNASDLQLKLGATLAVSGSVQNDLGEPLDSFSVRANRKIQEGENPLEERESQEFASAAGNFSLTGLSPGTWSLRASSENHSSSEELEIQVPSTQPVGFQLMRSAGLEGIVLSPDGLPVSGAAVRASGSGQRRLRERTDDDGRFVFENVLVGYVSLVAESEDWAVSLEEVVEVTAGVDVGEITLNMRQGARLTGEVFLADGSPAPNVQIMFNGDSWGGTVETDENGQFVREHVDPGSYQLFAMPNMEEQSGDFDFASMMSKMLSASVDLADGDDKHVVLGAAPKSPVLVRGRVTRAGEPVAGTMISVVGEAGTLDGLKFETTDENGRYQVTLDEPGFYTVSASSGMGDPSAAEFPVRIPDQPEFDLDLNLPGGGLRGLVLDEKARPVADVTISVQREGDRLSLSALGSWRELRSSSDGSFSVPNLKPGNYTLRANPRGDQNARAMLEGLVVADEQFTEGIVVRLPKPGVLEGVVRDSSGTPVREATIFLHDDRGQPVFAVSRLQTDAGGKFSISDLAPGLLTVSAREEANGLATPKNERVRVLAGEKSEVELTIEAGAYLIVETENGDKEPVRAMVDVLDENEQKVSGLFSSNFSNIGRATSRTSQTVGPLPPGRYQVSATSFEGKTTSRPVTLRAGMEKKIRLKL